MAAHTGTRDTGTRDTGTRALFAPVDRLVAPALVPVAAEDTDKDMPDREQERLVDQRAASPHRPDSLDTAHMAAGRLERQGKPDTAGACRLALHPNRAGRARMAADQPLVVLGPTPSVVSLAAGEQLARAAVWPETASPRALRWPRCPAVQHFGSVAHRIPDTVCRLGAWPSRNAGRIFHPRH